MPRQYLQHGDRHRTGGTDPIPGLGGGITWAEISTPSTYTVAAYAGSPGVKNIDMDHTAMYTNDSSVFGVETVVLSAATVHGIGVLVPGHYLCKATVALNNGDTTGSIGLTWSATPGHQAILGSAGANVLPIGGGLHGSNELAVYMETLVTCGSITYPTDPFVIQVANYTGAIITVATIDMIVIQMDTDQTLIS